MVQKSAILGYMDERNHPACAGGIGFAGLMPRITSFTPLALLLVRNLNLVLTRQLQESVSNFVDDVCCPAQSVPIGVSEIICPLHLSSSVFSFSYCSPRCLRFNEVNKCTSCGARWHFAGRRHLSQFPDHPRELRSCNYSATLLQQR